MGLVFGKGYEFLETNKQRGIGVLELYRSYSLVSWSDFQQVRFRCSHLARTETKSIEPEHAHDDLTEMKGSNPIGGAAKKYVDELGRSAATHAHSAVRSTAQIVSTGDIPASAS